MFKYKESFILLAALYFFIPTLWAQSPYTPPHILIQDSFEAQFLRPELSLDSVAETSTTFAWQQVPDASYYQLFYANADFAALTEATLDGLTDFAAQHNGGSRRSSYTSTTLYNLPPASRYYAVLVAQNNELNSPMSNIVEFITYFPAPLLIQGKSYGIGTATLSWQALLDASGYSVYFSPVPFEFNNDSDKAPQKLAAHVANTGGTVYANVTDTTLTIDGLDVSQTYYFVVTAHKHDGQGDIEGYADDNHAVTIRGAMNDTGVVLAETNADSSYSDCENNTVGQQDCRYGRDFTDNNNADGWAGFHFVKLDSDGNELAADADSWACVRDVNTGLIWEVKSAYNKNNTYTHYDSRFGGENDLNDNRINGGDDGVWAGVAANGSESYAEALQNQPYCGLNDWRLPTREELRSIVNYGATASNSDGDVVMIDLNYFPYTTANDYWTASPSVGDPQSAWTVFFGNGTDSSRKKDSVRRLRLVSGNQ